MFKINMYSVCFKKKALVSSDSDKQEAFVSFGFPFYAKDDAEARDLVIKSWNEALENEKDFDVDPFWYSLYKLGTWMPEDKKPLNVRYKFIDTLDHIIEKESDIIDENA